MIFFLSSSRQLKDIVIFNLKDFLILRSLLNFLMVFFFYSLSFLYLKGTVYIGILSTRRQESGIGSEMTTERNGMETSYERNLSKIFSIGKYLSLNI